MPMHAAGRPYLAAGVALAGASVIAVTPISPSTPNAIHSAKLDVRLAAAATNSNGATIPTSEEVDAAIANGDIRNVPLNLLYTFANVPYNETKAINQLAASLLYTGNWWVPSGTNVWGEDPADPGHFESIVSVGNPYPALSNIMGYQLAMVAAALLPATDTCDAEGCSPLTPVLPLTGITALDRLIYLVEIVIGLRKFPLVNNWFSEDAFSGLLSEDGYTYPDDLYTSVSTGVGPGGSIPTQTYTDSMGNTYTFTGTKGEETFVMPWAGTAFTWDPLLPWKALYASLVSTPDTTGGEYGTGIRVASPEDVIYAFQALLAGLVVDFNPFVPGSAFCPGQCDTTFGITTPVLVKWISDLYPGNPLLEDWLEYEAAGQANGPTPEQEQIAIDILQSGLFTFDEETTATLNAALANIHPVLPSIAADSGLLDGWNLNALVKDIGELTGISAALKDLGDQLGVDEALQEVDAVLKDISAKLDTELKKINAALKDVGDQLDATFKDVATKLGVDKLREDIDAALTELGTALNEAGSFPKTDTSPSTEDLTSTAVQAVSAKPLTTSSASTNVTTAPGATQSEVTKGESTLGQQARSIARVLARAAEPSAADPTAGQIPESASSSAEQSNPTITTPTAIDKTDDVGTAVSGTADGSRTEPGGGLARARKSAGDQVSAGGTGGRHRAKADSSDNTGNTGNTGGTGGRHRAK
jgi:hypothetical protein